MIRAPSPSIQSTPPTSSVLPEMTALAYGMGMFSEAKKSVVFCK
jgi:hypothetical protein